MIDAVLSYHMNPMTCGVAKFNHQLAERLGVPCQQMGDWKGWTHPLLSYKMSEWPTEPGYCPQYIPTGAQYDVFLHDWRQYGPHRFHMDCAQSVYAANRVIADAIRPHRPDVITAWCPSTLCGAPRTYRVLAFGMAHKLALEKFRELKQQLELEHPDYTVSLSTAVHEGSPWDTALTESTNAMRAIFGDKLRVLGFLLDDALAEELRRCDAVAVYFDPAARENNTTLWTALEAGKRVYTNLDVHSPALDPAKYSWNNLVRLLA